MQKNSKPMNQAKTTKTVARIKPRNPKKGAVNEEKTPFDRLADNEQIFVLEYLTHFNATKAAMASGSKPSCARQTGYRLLTKDYIQEALRHEQRKRAEALRADQARILEEEAIIAFFDPAEAFNPRTGELRPPHELPEYIRRNLQNVDMDKETRTYPTPEGDEEAVTTTRFKYRFNDKGRALERLSKHLGLFKDNIRLEVESFQNTVVEVLQELGPDAARAFLEKLKQRRDAQA